MNLKNKEKAIALIQSFETGSSKALDYISDKQYIQHNLNFPEGKEAIKGFFTNKATGIKVEIHRALEDKNLVVLHTTLGGVWNNGKPQAAIDVFRFDNGLIVEHWDNISTILPPNSSGRTMVDGATKVSDIDKTKANKLLAKGLVEDVLINGKIELFSKYINSKKYLQHNPEIADGLESVLEVIQLFYKNGISMKYTKIHQIIGEGNFILVMSEGIFGKGEGLPTAYYDLFRISKGLIVEHWDILETIPNQVEWKNQNGKF